MQNCNLYTQPNKRTLKDDGFTKDLIEEKNQKNRQLTSHKNELKKYQDL